MMKEQTRSRTETVQEVCHGETGRTPCSETEQGKKAQKTLSDDEAWEALERANGPISSEEDEVSVKKMKKESQTISILMVMETKKSQ